MHISGLTGSQVWLSSSRSLTNFGSGALAVGPVVFNSIAGASNVDLRPSAGIVAFSTVAVITNAAATNSISITMWDGTNSILLAVTTAGASAATSFNGVQNSAVGFRVNNNDATHAGNYSEAQALLTI